MRGLSHLKALIILGFDMLAACHATGIIKKSQDNIQTGLKWCQELFKTLFLLMSRSPIV